MTLTAHEDLAVQILARRGLDEFFTIFSGAGAERVVHVGDADGGRRRR